MAVSRPEDMIAPIAVTPKGARPKLIAWVSVLGLALVVAGQALPDTNVVRVFLLVAGASILLTGAALALSALLAQRRLSRDIAVFEALHAATDDAILLVEPATQSILWMTDPADSIEGAALGGPIAGVLAGFAADPSALVMRLHEIADAKGLARHVVPLSRRDWQATVRPAGHGRFLWQIDPAKTADPRDDLPFQIVQTNQSGAITYCSANLLEEDGPKPRRLSDLFEQALPPPGMLAQLTTRLGASRYHALRLPADGTGETIVLLQQPNILVPDRNDFEALQHLPVAIALIAPDARLVWFNDETQRLLRLRAGTEPSFCDLFEGLGRPVAEWLADLRAGRLGVATEVLRAVNPAGDRFLQVTLRPYGTDNDLLAIMHDATEFKALEAKFTQSQKMQAIGQLAGGVAHDFNNLLTAISGHCDLILLRHDRSDIDYPDLMQIQQNTNRAAALVRQLLAFSRKQTLQFETLDLHDLLADAIHLLNRLVGERVTLTLRYGPDMPLIRSDKRQFEQVLMNLVVNARDAMPMGGEVVIETEHCSLPNGLSRDRATVPPGNYAVIRVRDEGVGMAPAVLSKVFDPFFSTKRQGEGTGLGLSTVYGIIKQSGGFIFVDSEEGQGTTFSIYFAAQAASDTPAKPVIAPKTNVSTVARSTILLVEDEAPVRSFAARALQLQGHRVLEADCGEAALKILSDPTVRPDVFVTDVIMPGLDGPAWVAEIRDRFPDTPIVFMSGYAEDSRVAAQSSFGKAVFIGKPFSLSEFTQLVNEQVRKLSEAA
ncbi:MAG: response regulator [Rhodobacteraceae bacterium]|nr:response regulator [Paracoccaceae bacterium]